MQITAIDMLVHPLCAQEGRRDRVPHAIEVGIRSQWDERVLEISQDPQRVFLYFPWTVTRKEMGSRFRGKLQDVQMQELAMIEAYRQRLGERFVIFPDGEAAPHELERIFAEKGWDITNETRIMAYGEVYEVCVQRWPEHVMNALDIPAERVTHVPELSMTQNRIATILGERLL